MAYTKYKAHTRLHVPDFGDNCANSQFNLLAPPDNTTMDVIASVQPVVWRFPGGTIANYTRTSGLGYNFVVDPDVPIDATSMAQQQAAIDSGRCTTNYLPEMVAWCVRQQA